MLGPHTDAPGSSFSRGGAWPTPIAKDCDNPHSGKNAQGASHLSEAVTLWPTPDASAFNDSEDLESWQARRAALRETGANGNGMGTPLAVAVRLWPTATATASDANGSGSAGYQKSPTHNPGVTLVDAVVRNIWATPTARDEKGPGPGHSKGGSDLASDVAFHSHKLPHRSKGMLNPDWVECLMGFPIGWTKVDGWIRIGRTGGPPLPGRKKIGNRRASRSKSKTDEPG